MQEALEPHAPLYDAYASRLHVYCWSLVGDDAPNALHEAFVTAARQGSPRGGADSPLWLYRLARTACVRRGALDYAFTRIRDTDPLRHAAAGLRADHREVLVLSAGGWMEEPDIAQLLGVATDTVAQLIGAARKRLERGVLDVLLPGPIRPEHEEIIAAFEKGTLDALFAKRAPAWPPVTLRADVLAACAEQSAAQAQVTRSFRAAEGPLVVIGPGNLPEFSARRRPGRAFVGVVGLAAAAAAAAGVFAALPVTGGSSPQSNGQNLMVPSASGSQQQVPAAGGRSAATPQQTGASPATSSSVPYNTAPGGSTVTPTPSKVLADPRTDGRGAVPPQTPSGHLSSPTFSSSSTPGTTPSPLPSATGSSTPSSSPSTSPSDTSQVNPAPVDTATPVPAPSP